METEDRKMQALETEVAQLRFALASRIVIEQAKGALSVTHNIPPDEAFDLLRRYARSRRRNVHEVATEVVRNRGLLAD